VGLHIQVTNPFDVLLLRATRFHIFNVCQRICSLRFNTSQLEAATSVTPQVHKHRFHISWKNRSRDSDECLTRFYAGKPKRTHQTHTKNDPCCRHGVGFETDGELLWLSTRRAPMMARLCTWNKPPVNPWNKKSLALALTAFPLRQLSRSSDISQMGILTYILPAAYLKFPGCFPALISHPLTYFFLLLFNF
jgi:hypothetical protein